MFRAIRESVLKTGWSLGLYTPPDRIMLDRILRVFADRDACNRVLFVGVKHYNRHFPGWFVGRTFATIDPVPDVAQFGGKPHYVDVLERLDRYVEPGAFDLVVMNGVIGFGLDDPCNVETALQQVSRALAPTGDLVLGINEHIPTHVDLTGIEAARRFRPKPFELLGGARIVLETPFRERTHTFEFWEKKP